MAKKRIITNPNFLVEEIDGKLTLKVKDGGINRKVAVAQGNNTGETMINTTYAELKSLRDKSKLIPGIKYRITDYVFATTQPNARQFSNYYNHPNYPKFDIIVTAISSSEISPDAKVTHHLVYATTSFKAYMGYGNMTLHDFYQAGFAIIEDRVVFCYIRDDGYNVSFFTDDMVITPTSQILSENLSPYPIEITEINSSLSDPWYGSAYKSSPMWNQYSRLEQVDILKWNLKFTLDFNPICEGLSVIETPDVDLIANNIKSKNNQDLIRYDFSLYSEEGSYIPFYTLATFQPTLFADNVFVCPENKSDIPYIDPNQIVSVLNAIEVDNNFSELYTDFNGERYSISCANPIYRVNSKGIKSAVFTSESGKLLYLFIPQNASEQTQIYDIYRLDSPQFFSQSEEEVTSGFYFTFNIKSVTDINFKGTILNLIDEYNNNLNFDFKHALFVFYNDDFTFFFGQTESVKRDHSILHHFVDFTHHGYSYTLIFPVNWFDVFARNYWGSFKPGSTINEFSTGNTIISKINPIIEN